MQTAAAGFKGEEADYVIGAMLTAAILGPSAAFLVAGFAMYALGWRAALALSAAPVAVLTPFIARRRAEGAASRRAPVSVAKRPIVWLLGLAYACHYALVRGFLSWLPTILVEIEGFDSFSASLLSGTVPLASACAAALGSAVSRRAGVQTR